MPLLLRLALRDLRGGLSGFGIFLATIALGVAAITGVGSVSRALSDGLARQGRVILGGDVVFDLVQRAATPAEEAFMRAHGTLTSISVLRAMARRTNGETALVELKAVGAGYPAAGQVVLSPAMRLPEALARRGTTYGVVVDPALLARLDVKVGDRIGIGEGTYQIRSSLTGEPDKLAAGIGLGPRVLMSDEGLAASGLIQPGSLVRQLYRVALPQVAPGRPADLSSLHRFVGDAEQAFPGAGWEVRTRENVSPQFSRDLARFTQFLTLVGLTALVIGGVGVANAIRGFVERKRPVIATLKAVGATGTRVFAIMLIEVALVAALGIVIGLLFGIAAPFAVSWIFGAVLPIPLAPALYPEQIGAGALYGTLTALAFALGPLGRAHDVPVAALFRDGVEPNHQRLRRRYFGLVALAAVALVGSILLLSGQRSLSAYYILASLGAFAILRGVAWLVAVIARRSPRFQGVALRLAVANIHRPGALTPSVVLSLGLGLALLVTLTLIDANIRAQLHQATPGQTPSFFFLDVQSAEVPAFRAFLHDHVRDGRLEFVPMMRGRITAVNGVAADKIKPSEKSAWVLQGDRGLTFSEDVPVGSKLVKGTWWAADYSGKPLVSLESDIARGLGLRLGDTITVNVFGREITATIASTRLVDWRKFGINFVLVFSPNTFRGAPFSDLATVTLPKGSDAHRELTLLREVAQAYPSITTIRVKDALDAVASVVGQLATAIRGAAGVALFASVLVLAGALAAGQESRLHDAVVLKTLGATRRDLLTAFALEFAIIGFATALFGVVAGSVAAYGIVAGVMSLGFQFFWSQAIYAAVGALALTVGLGLVGTWRVLGRKPAPYLRAL